MDWLDNLFSLAQQWVFEAVIEPARVRQLRA
jgi:hypothetical protein